ncbi:MAG: hypothetical protein C9356_15290 [Oleiphilus sp.]|nr:MAG: hypothetical protein C9356_15290 [Oleiphilus sp.]
MLSIKPINVHQMNGVFHALLEKDGEMFYAQGNDVNEIPEGFKIHHTIYIDTKLRWPVPALGCTDIACKNEPSETGDGQIISNSTR